MMRLFLQFELGKVAKYFKTKTLAKAITSLLFLGVFGFVALGIYFFFITGFRYINIEAVDDIKFALTLFLYEAFLLVLAGIVIVSALVSGVFNLYRGEYNNWIISSPGYSLFPKVILLRSTLTSALPSLVMFLPAILAFNKVYDVGSISLFFILVSVLLLVLLLNAATLSALVAVSYLYYAVTKRVQSVSFNLKGLVLLLVASLSLLLAWVWKKLVAIDLVQLFKAEDVDNMLSVANIGSYFNGLPTHTFALQIVSFQAGSTGVALLHFCTLTLISLAFVALWWIISPRFYPMWQKLQEGSGAGLNQNAVNGVTYKFSGSPLAVLFKKELLVSSRNFKGVLWFLFLFSIWLLQIAMSVLLDNNIRRHEADVSAKFAVVQALQFVIAIYFISAFALRFVFPAFSVEKKTSWILGSAPISFKKIFHGKYFFYVSFFAVVGALMSYVNIQALNLSLSSASYSFALLISVIVLIITFALSLGAIFPNTETDDPEVITTSIGGLFFTALSLIYGTLSGWLLYQSVIQKDVTHLVIFIGATLMLSLVMLLKTPSIVGRNLFNQN